MSLEILNSVEQRMPAASSIHYASAGAILGRKVCLAAGYKIGALVADFMNNNNVAADWNKASDDYLIQAKKEIAFDAAAAGALAIAGLTIDHLEKITVSSPISPSKAFFVIAGIIANRKVCRAAGYKIGAVVAKFMGKNNLAADWDKARVDYVTQAKKEILKDLRLAMIFAGSGLSINIAQNIRNNAQLIRDSAQRIGVLEQEIHDIEQEIHVIEQKIRSNEGYLKITGTVLITSLAVLIYSIRQIAAPVLPMIPFIPIGPIGLMPIMPSKILVSAAAA